MQNTNTTQNRRQRPSSLLLIAATTSLVLATGAGLLSLNTGYQEFKRSCYETPIGPSYIGLDIQPVPSQELINEENH